MSDSLTKLAVLIPFYGRVSSLRETLRSLAAESFLHHAVVVDDGNVPRLQIPAEWHPHAIVLKHDRNRGITEALNTGLRYANEHGYEFIARLDAGDHALPGRLAKQVSFLEDNPDCQLVGTQARFVDEEGRFLYRSNLPTQAVDIHRELHRRSCFIHPAVMLRARVFQKIGQYRERYPAAEDYDLFFRIAEQFPTANLDEPLITYEVSSASISTRRRRQQLFSRLRIVLAHFDFRLIESYRGLIETVIAILVPRSMISGLHSFAYKVKTHSAD